MKKNWKHKDTLVLQVKTSRDNLGRLHHKKRWIKWLNTYPISFNTSGSSSPTSSSHSLQYVMMKMSIKSGSEMGIFSLLSTVEYILRAQT